MSASPICHSQRFKTQVRTSELPTTRPFCGYSLPRGLLLRATLGDGAERFATLGARFEKGGLGQHSYCPVLHLPRLSLLNLQHVTENEHGLDAKDQRERSTKLAVRGFVKAIAHRGKGRLNEFRATVLTTQLWLPVGRPCRLFEQTG